METITTESLDPKIWAAIIAALASVVISVFSFFNSRKTIILSTEQQKKLEEHKVKLIQDQQEKLEAHKARLQQDQLRKLEEHKSKLLYKQQELLNSHRADLDSDLEEHKATLQKMISQNIANLELKKGKLIESLSSIEVGISDIQRVKTASQLFLHSIPERMNLEELVDNYKKARNSIFVNYENVTSVLLKRENAVYHNAKRETMALERKLDEFLRSAKHSTAKNTMARIEMQLLPAIRIHLEELTEYQNQLREIRFAQIKNGIYEAFGIDF